MAIIQTEIENNLILSYSDQGFYIRGGNPEGLYSEAVDPKELGRTYEETDIKIEEESTDEEYIEAAKILLGEEDVA